MWREIDRESPEGREARARLRAADRHYRDGVRRLEQDRDGARAELAAGVAIAPMDPSLYLRLARACRAQGLSLRAAEYYSKFLAVFPESAQSDAAREELEALDPRLAGLFEAPLFEAAPEPVEAAPIPWRVLGAGVLLGVALTMLLLFASRWMRLRGVRLGQLVARSPEFHPSVAYLVGSLRHEFLKHRIGAASDALKRAGPEGREFLRERLYGGQPLREAWEGHLGAFERALGHRVDLRRDPWFRRADRAVRQIARLQAGVIAGSPRAMRRLAKSHRALSELDAHLADMIGGLVRTSVDVGLLQEVVDEVRSEHTAGEVELDGCDVMVGFDEPVLIDVFRVDLVLILKNIARNAILAVAKDAPPRRVRLDVKVELEATGEETVQLRVHDTSSAKLDPELLFDRRVDRGLGLVAAAVHRYGGTIDVELAEAQSEFAKSVVVSFFRTD